MKYISLEKIPEQSVSHNPDIKKKVMLNHCDIPHLTNFSQAKLSPGQVSKAHFHHNMWEVFFVEAGVGTIRVNHQSYPLHKGSCVTVEPGEIHEIINTGVNELIVTYFGVKVS